MRRKIWACLLSGLLLLSFPGASLGASFGDVDGHWGAPAIDQVADWGLMKGIGVDEQGLAVFAPEMAVTRAQAATVLVNVFNLDWGSKRFIKQPLASDYYTDVSEQDWYAGALVMCGINEVFPTGEFHPNQAISRIDMATAIKKSFDAKGISIPMIMLMPVFQDTGDISNEQLNDIAFVNNTGIMQGAGKVFRPHDSMSRAELAQILCNIKNVIKNQGESGKTSDINDSFDGKEYRTTAGSTFVLSLSSNPTTGYEWTLADTMDKSILTPVDHNYQSDKAPQGWTGMGGTDYWTFKALKDGTAEIKLVYARPWESVQPAQTFTVKVIVGKNAAIQPVFKVDTKEVKEEAPYMKVGLKIPVFSGLENQDVQKTLNAMLEKEALDFKKEVAAGISDYLKEVQEATANPFGAYTEYVIGSTDKSILSFYIDYYQYTGGAHGSTFRKAYNIDLKTGKNLALQELFKPGYDYRTPLNAAVQDRINAAADEYFEGSMGFNGILEDQGYYIEDDNLVVYFQQYEIAAYARGIPEFKMPLSQLKAGLAYNID